MVTIENRIDNLFREVRKISFYNAIEYTFSQNYLRNELLSSPVVVVENIIPEGFERNIKIKKTGRNICYDVNCSVIINGLKADDLKIWYLLLNRKGFVVEIESNEEITIIGNSNEPMSVDIIDNIKEDNSGNDSVVINFYGQTIIEPWIKPL